MATVQINRRALSRARSHHRYHERLRRPLPHARKPHPLRRHRRRADGAPARAGKNRNTDYRLAAVARPARRNRSGVGSSHRRRTGDPVQPIRPARQRRRYNRPIQRPHPRQRQPRRPAPSNLRRWRRDRVRQRRSPPQREPTRQRYH